MESFPSANYLKWDDDRAWSCIETYERSGRPDETSWKMIRKADLVAFMRKFFSTEPRNPLGTRKLLVTDRGDLMSILKKKHGLNNSLLNTMKQNWKSGECSGAKKTEKNFECHRKWRKTFYDLGNVYGCNIGISSIHGKALPEQLSIHCKHDRSHTQTNVRHICKIEV